MHILTRRNILNLIRIYGQYLAERQHKDLLVSWLNWFFHDLLEVDFINLAANTCIERFCYQSYASAHCIQQETAQNRAGLINANPFQKEEKSIGKYNGKPPSILLIEVSAFHQNVYGWVSLKRSDSQDGGDTIPAEDDTREQTKNKTNSKSKWKEMKHRKWIQLLCEIAPTLHLFPTKHWLIIHISYLHRIHF